MKYDKQKIVLLKLLAMKKMTTDAIINILLVVIISSAALYMLVPAGLISHTAGKSAISDTAISERSNRVPVQATPTSCDRCRQQQDSLDRAAELRNGKFHRDMGTPFGQAVRGSFYTDAEIIGSRGYENINKDEDHFFALPYWDLADADSRHGTVMYYVSNKQAYVNAFDYSQNKQGTRKSREVSFKYDPKHKQILIPVNGSQYKAIRISFIIFAVIYISLTYLFVIEGVIKFLLSVARGVVFTEKNIRRLKMMAFVSFFVPLSFLALNYFYKFIFHNYFNEYVVFKTELFYDQIKYFGIPLICFLLYKAFNKGYKLQRENDLTV
ncbi:DUF2975 domain-containing protein [Niabella hirudinis]|uniref:DUF2975 domain-containing protein n=1 Tax=Niabella hirudinis TaxID=1285929 RepID=UPI003EBF7AFB